LPLDIYYRYYYRNKESCVTLSHSLSIFHSPPPPPSLSLSLYLSLSLFTQLSLSPQ
jgi:hypothetical protein